MVNLRLEATEIARRAARLRLVMTDCDGVLTDGSVYCGEQGEALLKFSRRDGMGFERLRDHGVDALIVTRESSPIVERRAAKLGVRLLGGVREKAAVLDSLRVMPAEVAYMGDDLNDLALMKVIAPQGLVAAPRDAEAPVAEIAHVLCSRAGGAGAFRELVELILSLRAARGTT